MIIMQLISTARFLLVSANLYCCLCLFSEADTTITESNKDEERLDESTTADSDRGDMSENEQDDASSLRTDNDESRDGFNQMIKQIYR